MHTMKIRTRRLDAPVHASPIEYAAGPSVSVAARSLRIPELLTAAVEAVPLQLLAYATAKARGRDVDKPRNLAKTVTVE